MFTEQEVVADVSEIFNNASSDKVITIPLVRMPSSVALEEGDVSVGENVPFEAEIESDNNHPNHYTLTLTFNSDFNLINPGATYPIVFNNEETLNVVVVYSYPYNANSWKKTHEDAEGHTISEINTWEPILSKTANKRWLAIFRTALAAWHKTKENAHFYFYKNRYLNEMLQFTSITGALPEDAEAEIEYVEGTNRIDYVLVKYFNRYVKAEYKYEDSEVYRYDALREEYIKCEQDETVITQIVVSAVDEKGVLLKNLGTITYIRESREVSIPNAPDYIEDMSPTSAIFMLSQFKKYKINAVTGYSVRSR